MRVNYITAARRRHSVRMRRPRPKDAAPSLLPGFVPGTRPRDAGTAGRAESQRGEGPDATPEPRAPGSTGKAPRAKSKTALTPSSTERGKRPKTPESRAPGSMRGKAARAESKTAPSPGNTERGESRAGPESLAARHTRLKAPRFLPVHRGVRLGAPASLPARSVVDRPQRPMRAHERPRFAFARQPAQKRRYLGPRFSPSPPPPSRDTDVAEIGLETLLGMDLTGAAAIRRCREKKH